MPLLLRFSIRSQRNHLSSVLHTHYPHSSQSTNRSQHVTAPLPSAIPHQHSRSATFHLSRDHVLSSTSPCCMAYLHLHLPRQRRPTQVQHSVPQRVPMHSNPPPTLREWPRVTARPTHDHRPCHSHVSPRRTIVPSLCSWQATAYHLNCPHALTAKMRLQYMRFASLHLLLFLWLWFGTFCGEIHKWASMQTESTLRHQCSRTSQLFRHVQDLASMILRFTRSHETEEQCQFTCSNYSHVPSNLNVRIALSRVIHLLH